MMKKNDAIEKVFHRLSGELDIATPNASHESRFLKKLQQQAKETPVISISKDGKGSRKAWLSIAATVLIMVGMLTYFLTYKPTVQADLASVSPELEKTQEFFTTAITKQLQVLKNTATTENQVLVTDAIEELNGLENNYDQLKKDLVTSGNDQRVISAMIRNFQKRITLLENVLQNVQEINNLKFSKDETQSI